MGSCITKRDSGNLRLKDILLSKNRDKNIKVETEMEEGKTIEEGPARTPLFITHMPTSITYSGSLEVAEYMWCMWRTPVPDCIMLGGLSTPTLCVVDNDLNITTHRLTRGDEVKRGVCVSMEKSIVRVHDKNSNAPSVYTCNIDVTSRSSCNIDPIGIFQVSNPIDVFRWGKNKYGILCENPTRVEKYLLRDILIETTIEPTDSISLDYPKSYEYDRACFTPDSLICVSSSRAQFSDPSIFVYNELGERLYTLGQGWRRAGPASPGRVDVCMSMQYCENGGLIAAGLYGDIHVYNGKDWALLKDRRSMTRGVCLSLVTESKVSCLREHRLMMYYIDKTG